MWVQVLLRLTPEELAGIDRVRGEVPRSRWVRRVCREAVAAEEHRKSFRTMYPKPELMVKPDGAIPKVVDTDCDATKRSG